MAAACAVWLGLAFGSGHGAATAATGPASAMPLAGLALALAFGLLALRAPPRVGTVAVLLALACAGVARGAAASVALARERAPIFGDGRACHLRARVATPVERASGEPAALVVVESSDAGLTRGARIRLALPAGCGAEWGDRIDALVRLERPEAARNPGAFDALAAAGAAARAAEGRALAVRVRPDRGPGGWPRATVVRWRRAIEARLDSCLTPDARELVLPLVVGDRSGLPPDVAASFRASGLVYLLVLSGLHVGWLAGMARGACAALGGGPRARAAAGAAAALLYGGIAGPLPPLLRAAVNEGLTAVARAVGCALDAVQALALTALLLLLVAPGWAGDTGFQLSCSATLGIATVGRRLARPGAARARAALVLGRVRAALAPTLSAQLLALPILVARLHAVSWTGAAANLVAVPVTGLLLGGAWLAVLLDLAVPGIGAPFFHACDALAFLLRAVANRAGGWPGAMAPAGHDPALTALAALGAALLAVTLAEPGALAEREAPASRARVAGALAGGLALLTALVLLATVRSVAPPPGRVWIVMLDVGQGDAIAIGAGGDWRLVDTGPRSPRSDAGERVVLPFLRWSGVRSLASVALTHDDSDHTGGADAVARGIPVRAWWVPPPWPGVRSPGRGLPARAVARGDTLSRSPAIVALWPPRPGTAGEWVPMRSLTSPDNDAGLVLELTVGTNPPADGAAGFSTKGSARALFLADVDSTVEESLRVTPSVAWLKVAHHGSASSSGARFLARVRPAVAAISVGRNNRFGHPAPQALERIAASGAAIARTDASGALWFELGASGTIALDWRDERSLTPPEAARVATPSAPRAPLRP